MDNNLKGAMMHLSWMIEKMNASNIRYAIGCDGFTINSNSPLPVFLEETNCGERILIKNAVLRTYKMDVPYVFDVKNATNEFKGSCILDSKFILKNINKMEFLFRKTASRITALRHHEQVELGEYKGVKLNG